MVSVMQGTCEGAGAAGAAAPKELLAAPPKGVAEVPPKGVVPLLKVWVCPNVGAGVPKGDPPPKACDPCSQRTKVLLEE